MSLDLGSSSIREWGEHYTHRHFIPGDRRCGKWAESVTCGGIGWCFQSLLPGRALPIPGEYPSRVEWSLTP